MFSSYRLKVVKLFSGLFDNLYTMVECSYMIIVCSLYKTETQFHSLFLLLKRLFYEYV